MQPPGEGVETAPGKPHPLESAVSQQLDSIDLDEADDWGLQEVRASVTVTTATKQQTGVRWVSGEREKQQHHVVNGTFSHWGLLYMGVVECHIMEGEKGLLYPRSVAEKNLCVLWILIL